MLGWKKMRGIPKELPDGDKNSVKEATLAMYSALHSHYVVLLHRQSTVIGWLIGLIGAVVGVLTTVEMPGLCQPLLVAVVSGKDKNALFSFAVLHSRRCSA